MALLAGNRAGRIRARWAQVIAPTPGRAEFAVRMAIICLLTTLITEMCQTPEAALSAYIVFFINRPDRATSVLISTGMIILVGLVIVLLLAMTGAALYHPAIRLAIMVGLSLFLLFLTSASKLKPVASIVTMILAFAIDLLGQVPIGEMATRALLYACLFVGIPAAVTIVVNLLIGPAPRRLAEQAIAQRLRFAASLLRADPALPGTPRQRRQDVAPGALGFARMALLERTSPRSELLAIQQAVQSSATLLMLAFELNRTAAVPLGWRLDTARTLDEMAAVFERGRCPVDIDTLPSPAALRGTSTAVLTADLYDVLRTFSTPPAAEKPAVSPEKSGFFVTDAFTNPVHVRFAIKVTMAAMLCYLFYSLADWPGIHTCLITCYIVALDTAAETVEKLTLRIAGALVGAASGVAAILWVLPGIDHVMGLLALVFGGALVGGWIAGGSQRVAYAGFQLAFAFFLCVIQGTGPGFDLVVARDRIIGIMIGNAVIYFIFAWVWPVSIAGRVDAAISRLLGALAAIARLPTHADRREALPAARAAIELIENDLEIAHYEPTSTRPAAGWLASREQWIIQAEKGEKRLLLINDPQQLDQEASRLDELASKADAECSRLAVSGAVH